MITRYNAIYAFSEESRSTLLKAGFKEVQKIKDINQKEAWIFVGDLRSFCFDKYPECKLGNLTMRFAKEGGDKVGD